MLIQGSACIYSKKVEHLYNLVYESLNLIAEKKKGQRQQSSMKDGIDEDTALFDTRPFLELDDVIVEADGIDLVENEKAQVTPTFKPPAFVLSVQDEGSDLPSAFKINTGAIHESGAVLLAKEDGQFLDMNLCPRESPQQLAMDVDPAGDSDWHVRDESLPQTQEQDGLHFALNPTQGEDDDDDGPEPLPDFDDAPPISPGSQPSQLEAPASAGQKQAPVLRRPRPDQGDAWKLLDPDDVGSLPCRPLRKGTSRRRVRAPARAEQRALLSNVPPDAPIRGVAYDEFAYAYEALQKAKRSQRFAQARAMRGQAGGLEDMDDAENDGYWEAGMDGPAFSDDEPDTFDAGHPILDEQPAAYQQEYETLAQAAQHEMRADCEQTYEELVQAHVKALVSQAAAAERQTELHARVSEWKARIEPALEEQSHHPVFDIHEYGDVVIGEVHRKTDDLPEEEVDFAEIVAGCSVYEVRIATQGSIGSPISGTENRPLSGLWQICRRFAATLQLVNSANLGLTVDESSTTLDQLHLRLLSDDRAHKTFETFLAPSALVNATKDRAQLEIRRQARGKENVA
eukprot:scaffold1387_cov382-Prasinococcus_capsulatus_cf.AAC.3